MYEDAHLESAYEDRFRDDTDYAEHAYWSAFDADDEDDEDDGHHVHTCRRCGAGQRCWDNEWDDAFDGYCDACEVWLAEQPPAGASLV